MKHVWEVEDFNTNKEQPYGSIVQHHLSGNRYMIGYLNATGNNPCLISLDDGMVTSKAANKEDFVNFLNNGSYFPIVEYKRVAERK